MEPKAEAAVVKKWARWTRTPRPILQARTPAQERAARAIDPDPGALTFADEREEDEFWDTLTLAIRLLRRRRVDPETGCWIYTAAHTPQGYGVIGVGGRTAVTGSPLFVHRVAALLWLEAPVPEKPYVCHRCPAGPNRACFNPEHLYWGTHAENMQDMARAGTRAGENHARVRLSTEQAEEIKHLWATGHYKQRELAAMYQIAQSHVSRIVLGKLRARG